MRSAARRHRAAAVVGAGLLGTVGRTLRFEVEGGEVPAELRRDGKPIVFVFWHAWILPLAILHRNQGVVVLVSEHGDGEYVAQMIHRMGFGTSRGSSTRGGVRGARGIVRALRAGHDVAVTPDGPRGPARVFKPGGLVAAQLTGAAVVPVAVEATSVWRLRSWDRFAVPKPFGGIRVKYGAPRVVPRDSGPEALQEAARELESFLNAGEADD